MSSGRGLAVLLCDRESAPAVRSNDSLRVLRQPDPRAWQQAKHLFVVCSATGLPAVADLATAANRTHRLRALFVRENVEPEFLGSMLDRANLRLFRNLVVHHGSGVTTRVLRAWQAGAQDALIAEASLSEGRLFLLSCALERLELQIRDVPALARVADEDLTDFKLAEDGSYLHWPQPDVHLDLDAVRYLIEPAARRRMDLVRLAHDRRFGEAVASLRQARGLEQSAIPGVSERQVRRIEAGSMPRVSTLEKLAAAHGMTVDDYLADIADLVSSVRPGGKLAGRRRRAP
jgi:hypothetical protein